MCNAELAMDEILPYTRMSVLEHLPSPPPYVSIHTRTDVEQIRHALPHYLHGSAGVVALIQAFLGTGSKWVCVCANVAAMQIHRHRDAYFLYAVFSRRLALPRTVPELLQHASVPGRPLASGAGPTYVDTAARCLPLGRPGVFFTRTGHMGTSAELAGVCRLVRCPGHMVHTRPELPSTGRHLVVTGEHTPSAWPAHVCVRSPSTLSQADRDTHWESVVFFHVPGAGTTQYRSFPDARHLSGCINAVWADVHHCLPHRSRTLICTRESLSEACLLTYLHVLGVCFHGKNVLPRQFVTPLFLLVRVLETLFLNGVLLPHC